jgi:hypothetical protein
LGGVVAFGGIAALGAVPFGAGATGSGASTAGDGGKAGHTNTAVATSVSFAVDVYAHTPARHTVHLQVEGQMNFVRHTLTATVTVPAADLHASATNADLNPSGDTMQLHTEWVGRQAYLSVPSRWTAVAGGAQTVSLPTSPALQRMVTTALTQSAVALTYAKLLLNDLTEHQKPHRLGSRSIAGVVATGSQAQLTLPQLLKLVPQLSPTMTAKVVSMAATTIPATVWVDRHGRLVEVDLAATKGSAAWVSGTVQFSAYGAPATASLPAAATVKPIPPALKQLLGDWYYF